MKKQKSQATINWENSSGYVYFIAAGEPAIAIKIGISTVNDFKRRFSTIQGGNHEQLFLLGVMPCANMSEAMKREQRLHGKYADLQLAEKGWVGSAWFRPSEELLASIASETVKPEDTVKNGNSSTTKGLERTIYKKRKLPS